MGISFFISYFSISFVQLKEVMKASKLTKHHNCWVVKIGRAQEKKTRESWHGERKRSNREHTLTNVQQIAIIKTIDWHEEKTIIFNQITTIRFTSLHYPPSYFPIFCFLFASSKGLL
jgi:hypothetical protein